jgi:hypothetical protein
MEKREVETQNKSKVNEHNQTIEKQAADRATVRAQGARWDLNIAIFLFLVLIIVLILLFQGIDIAIVAPTAIFGLTSVWLAGWQRGKKLYGIFYEEELIKLKLESTGKTPNHKKTIEDTIEEQVQKALRENWIR